MMKLQLSSSNRAVVAMLAIVVLAGVFWTQLLSPRRDEASALQAQAKQLKTSLAQHEEEIAEAESAKKEFPESYQHLVVVGKAVPSGDETASLLVQVNRLAGRTGGTFTNLQLTASGSEGEAAAPAAAGSEGKPASPTEVAASLLPLGAAVGPAGLAVMPYDVTFDGNFFQIADFLEGLDALVETKSNRVRVDGRLVTVDGFSLEAAPDKGFPSLQASFALTTYLTPPGEGLAGGPPAESPGPEEATPASTTIGATR
jgi:Tfp pilus assembly protein PilO